MADVNATVQNAAAGIVGVIKALIVLFVFVNIIYSTGFDPIGGIVDLCLLYTSPSPRDKRQSRMPSSA